MIIKIIDRKVSPIKEERVTIPALYNSEINLICSYVVFEGSQVLCAKTMSLIEILDLVVDSLNNNKQVSAI